MLYFIPHAKVPSAAVLAKHGLSALVESPQGRETSQGPVVGDGPSTPGLIVAPADMPADRIVVDQSKQVWQKRFGSDALVGYWKDAKPTSRSLERSEQLRGTSITLADGNAYTVPILRSFDPNQLDGPFTYRVHLDRVLQQDQETGRMVPGAVVDKYADIWDMALSIGDCILKQVTSADATAASIEDETLENFVAGVLCLNYRLAKPEISLLRLLTIELQIEVMKLAIDWPTLETNLKNRLSRLS